ncbi:MAG: GGDEF domain-containing protein [Clostridiales bacterium]|nr:GGDEF domain-containing protein [Clostridiales bacterium]
MNSIQNNRQKSILPFLIPASIIAAAAIIYFVCVTGGTPNVYANLILIPIVLTSLYMPVWYSALFAMLSGIAMGPLVNWITNSEDQGLIWLIRAIIYVVVSIVVAYISTRSRKRERHFEYIATHDALTGLPNLNAISSSKIPTDGALSILMLAFNEDSDIQGLFGSDFYQSIVKKISEELKELLSSYPNATLYKGTDLDFSIIVQHYSSEESLENLLAAISNINGVTITVDSIPVYISYRIGFTVIRPAGNISEGIRHANIALRYSFLEDQQISRYTDAMRDYYRGTVSIASEFSSAISKGMVQASFQSIHEAYTHKPVGVEILAKWIRDDGSRMTAEEFVPILQKTSCLQQLTIFMTEEAIKYAKLPLNEGKKFSINFSGSELSERSVMEFVRAVEKSGVGNDRVTVEINGTFTEEDFLVRDNLIFLRKHGIRIAMDYLSAVASSFILLNDVPIDILKINRCITSHIDHERGAEMIKSIVKFAKANGIKTVAEGVENESQARFCEEAGVNFLQGYYFSVPQLLGDKEKAQIAAEESARNRASEEAKNEVEYPEISIVKKNGEE